MSSTGVMQQDIASLNNRSSNHQKYNSEDLRLLKRAQSSSWSINKIVEKNSLQDDLLSSIDKFIASIETRLDNIEGYFKPNSTDNTKGLEDDESIATLQNLYDTLVTIKNSVFSSSVNLESFNKVIDDHYGGLLSSIASSENLGFHEQLLTSLHFLDAKINQFNTLVKNETRSLLKDENLFSDEVSPHDSIRNFEIKFHNYEHALTHGSSRHLHYYELPFPWRENQFIVHGYRFQSNHLNSLKSIFTWHNETANIWSHLLGVLLMFYICLVDFPRSELFARNTLVDNLVIYLFLTASIKCLLSSSFWHTFNGTACLYLRKKFACIDYTGITVLITSSIVTTEYAALYYYPILRTGFILFSLFCGVCGFFFNWSSLFDRPESKPLRIGFYISLSALGFAAFAILGFKKGVLHALKFYAPITRSSIWYLTGVVFYGSLIPEKFRTDVINDVDQPEESRLFTDEVSNNLDKYFKEEPTYTQHRHTFSSLWWVDYIFASHNIWHVFVLLGILGHYSAIYEMFMNIPLNK